MIAIVIGAAPEPYKTPWSSRGSDNRTAGEQSGLCRGLVPQAERRDVQRGGAMAKRYGRPSAQYRYEHYDPRN